MKNSGICPKCHSTAIVPELNLVDYGRNQFASNTQVMIERNPNALVFKDRIYANVQAWVCGDCGYVEFYTGSHSELLEAYQERLAYTDVGKTLVPNAPDAGECHACGGKLKKGTRKCPECGAINE